MLRALALGLLLANLGYFVWGQGLLAAYGLKPARHSEPERLAQQIRPEAMQLITPAAAVSPTPAPTVEVAAKVSVKAAPEVEVAAAAAVDVQSPPAPPAGPACLQVGMFTERQARALRPRLQAGLAKGSWSLESSDTASRWIIYMGRYVSAEAMNRKRLKLEQLGLDFQPPASALLNPGLSLGSFASKADAEEVLAQLKSRGLRTARVVAEQPELPSFWLKLPVVDAALQTQLNALKPQLAGMIPQVCA